MNVSLINHGTTGELLLQGRLDSNASYEIEDIFKQVAERFDFIVLDLAGLEYISSSGLRTLKNLHIALKKKGGELTIKNTGRNVMEVMEITGMAGLLNFIE